jgi:hypothetical protein
METIFKKSWTRMAAIAMAAAMLFSALAVNPVVVHAQDGTPQADTSKLEEIYQKELGVLTKQDEHAAKIATIEGNVQKLIDKGNANGLDTSALSAALTAFHTSVATASASHANAASTLATHNGFDASGKVTDRTAAIQTLKDAGYSLKAAAETYKGGADALREAVRSWIEANRGYFNGKLEEAYQKAQEWLSKQQTNIGKLNDAAIKLQTLIEKAKAKGLDTSSLEAVVSDINSQLPQSQSAHNQAASILGTHAGFDASGKVTDVAAARQTLNSVRESLNASKTINVSLAQELRDAIQAWKAAHPKAAETPQG